MVSSVPRNAETFCSSCRCRSCVPQMKRTLDELATWLVRELAFPQGVLLMTGTGSVPPESFTLRSRDHVTVKVGELRLENSVA